MTEMTIAKITGKYNTLLWIRDSLLKNEVPNAIVIKYDVLSIYILEPQSTQIKYKTIESILEKYDKNEYKIQFKKCEIDV